MPTIPPDRDNRLVELCKRHSIHREIAPGEECTHSRTQQESTQESVDVEEYIERLLPEQIPWHSTVLIRYGLQHKADKDGDPHPKRPAKAGRVK